MDWMNRFDKSTNSASQPTSPADRAQGSRSSVVRNEGRKVRKNLSFHTISSITMLFFLTLLALTVIGFLMNLRVKDESRYVAKDRMQAVFLNGGQVYFGKIRELNNKYISITDIYYLRVNQQTQPQQGNQQTQQGVSLIKFGCEPHRPQDHMLINREHVLYWENLKDEGQVAEVIKAHRDANPEGQKCEDSPQAPPTNSDNEQQGSPNNQQDQNR